MRHQPGVLWENRHAIPAFLPSYSDTKDACDPQSTRCESHGSPLPVPSLMPLAHKHTHAQHCASPPRRAHHPPPRQQRYLQPGPPRGRVPCHEAGPLSTSRTVGDFNDRCQSQGGDGYSRPRQEARHWCEFRISGTSILRETITEAWPLTSAWS